MRGGRCSGCIRERLGTALGNETCYLKISHGRLQGSLLGWYTASWRRVGRRLQIKPRLTTVHPLKCRAAIYAKTCKKVDSLIKQHTKIIVRTSQKRSGVACVTGSSRCVRAVRILMGEAVAEQVPRVLRCRFTSPGAAGDSCLCGVWGGTSQCEAGPDPQSSLGGYVRDRQLPGKLQSHLGLIFYCPTGKPFVFLKKF